MKFEELLKKYKDGTASDTERAAVEEELEKVRLIEEYLAGEDLPLSLPEMGTVAAGEVKSVQRTINRRTRRTALAVVAGVLAVLLLLQFIFLRCTCQNIFQNLVKILFSHAVMNWNWRSHWSNSPFRLSSQLLLKCLFIMYVLLLWVNS